ncbi:MAG TPA: AI-2E family transporter [Rubrobacteraceae bacterium]|nr:AI-2E family transporter [Rubrobacteraceae bacterium]
MPARKLVVSTYLQYILIAVGVFLLVVFVRQLSGVLLTFLMAAVLAYALNPLVRHLEQLRVPRVLAVMGIFVVLTLAVVAALLVLIIPALGQAQTLIQNPEALVERLNGLVARARELPYVGERVAELDQEAIIGFVQSNAPSAGQMLQGATGFIGGVFGVFGTALNLVLMLIVSIYLLLDREKVTRAVLGAIPHTMRDQAVELFYAVERSLIKYLRGQLTLCVLMGIIGWAIAFFVIGRYSLVIGLWVGLTVIIPVIGAFLGAVPAILIALFVGGFSKALIVAGLFLVAQQIEGNFLVPKVMGGSVGVHPLWVLFATLAGTALYGIVGAIFAVPVVAIVAATLRYLRGTLIFERWDKALLVPATGEEPPTPSVAASLPQGSEKRESGKGVGT